jgi:hypothetical protein
MIKNMETQKITGNGKKNNKYQGMVLEHEMPLMLEIRGI